MTGRGEIPHKNTARACSMIFLPRPMTLGVHDSMIFPLRGFVACDRRSYLTVRYSYLDEQSISTSIN